MKLRHYVGHFFRTILCFYHQRYSSDWDVMLNHMLDNGIVKGIDQYTITLEFNGNLIEIWCSNRWYSFAHIYSINGKKVDCEMQCRPKMKTMIKVWGAYNRELCKALVIES